jgi:hypothetical protein
MLRLGAAPPARPVQADCVWKQRCAREERGARRPPPFALSEPPSAAAARPPQLDNKPCRGDEARPALDAGQASGFGGSAERPPSSSRSTNRRSRGDSNNCLDASPARGKEDCASVTGSVDSARSRDTRRSQWSLSSFRTEDSGFSYYASKKLADLEARMEEERRKREAAEAKLEQLMAILQRRDLLRK